MKILLSKTQKKNMPFLLRQKIFMRKLIFLNQQSHQMLINLLTLKAIKLSLNYDHESMKCVYLFHYRQKINFSS